MPDDRSRTLAKPVIAVVGPTASGKTRLAEELAVHCGGEVLTADSMQVYRGMDIGTAKVSPDHRQVPHHMIDLVDPGEPYSAALYQHDARAIIDRLLDSGTVPVLAGGTGLYLRAALDEMEFPRGENTSPTRERLEREASELGPEEMHKRLAELDPPSAELIHPNNVRRTIRALEMADEGVSYAEQASGFADRTPYYEATYIGLSLDRDALYRRIDARVDSMLADGLLDEVEALLATGYREALTSTQAIGYKEFVPVVEKQADREQAVADVKQASRRYAKRQLTWFRSDPRVSWIDVTKMSPGEVLDSARALVES